MRMNDGMRGYNSRILTEEDTTQKAELIKKYIQLLLCFVVVLMCIFVIKLHEVGITIYNSFTKNNTLNEAVSFNR